MTEDAFVDFIGAAARRVSQGAGQVGHLVLTQTRGTGRPTLREPEMRTALQQEAEARGRFYGIEVPTRYPYRFSGAGQRKALVDFALIENGCPEANRDVLVELKEGQPYGVRPSSTADPLDYPTLVKDLHKLLAEPVRCGRCMLHLCQSADAGTLPALQAKYETALLVASGRARATIAANPLVARDGVGDDRWLLLLVLVMRPREAQYGAAAAAGPVLLRAGLRGNHWDRLSVVP